MSEDEFNDDDDSRLSRVLKKLHIESTPADANFECTELLEKLRRIPELAHASSEPTALYAAPWPVKKLGQYELLERIAGGGMGEVFKARHQKLGNVVAIKLLYRDRLSDQELLDRFEQEMLAVGRLSHDHIVRPLYADEQDGVPYLVMEYVDGKTLAALLEEFTLAGEKFPIALACEAVRQAAIGLQHAHSHGIIHRDMKPSNLIMCRRDQGSEITEPLTAAGLRSSLPFEPDSLPLVKILDLGLARLNNPTGDELLADRKELTREGQVMGTPDYMAPEQLQDSRTVDARTDIYALGATLFKLLAGQAPFANVGDGSLTAKVIAIASQPVPTLKKFRSEIPDELERFIQSMLAKSPHDRPANASVVVSALSRFSMESASTENLSPDSVKIGALPERSGRRSRLRLALALIAVALLGATVFMLVDQKPDSRSTPTSTETSVDEAHSGHSVESPSTVGRADDASPKGEVPPKDVDRIAAEWVLALPQRAGFDGLAVHAQVLGTASPLLLKPGDSLPTERFRVMAATICNIESLTAEQITEYLVPLKNLDHVNLSFNVNMPVDVIRPLTQLKNLRVIEIASTWINGSECVELFSHWPELRSILVSSDQYTDELAEFVQRKRSIVRVALHSARDHHVQQLLKTRQLTELFFFTSSFAEHSTWELLPERLTDLELLSLIDSKIAHEDLVAFSRCPKLGVLLLRGATIADADLEALHQYRLLYELDVRNTKVTEAALRKLRETLPKCRITWDGGVFDPSP